MAASRVLCFHWPAQLLASTPAGTAGTATLTPVVTQCASSSLFSRHHSCCWLAPATLACSALLCAALAFSVSSSLATALRGGSQDELTFFVIAFGKVGPDTAAAKASRRKGIKDEKNMERDEGPRAALNALEGNNNTAIEQPALDDEQQSSSTSAEEGSSTSTAQGLTASKTPARRQRSTSTTSTEHTATPTSPNAHAFSRMPERDTEQRLSYPVPPTQPPTADPRSRSQSLVDDARQNKRLSLPFPIQTGSNVLPRPLPSPPLTATPLTSSATYFNPHSNVTSPVPGNPSSASTARPTGPSSGRPAPFLTMLAAQERRVLELREELSRAEAELSSLKRRWANSREAGLVRRRVDGRGTQIQPLQPLNTRGLSGVSAPHTALPAGARSVSNGATEYDDADGGDKWMLREMERRKALLRTGGSALNTPTSARNQRKVFAGSRHTRTLSLLSPDKMRQPFPQPADLMSDGQIDGTADTERDHGTKNRDTPGNSAGTTNGTAAVSTPTDAGRGTRTSPNGRPPSLPRSSTTPDIAEALARAADDAYANFATSSNLKRRSAQLDRDTLLRTGRQMANDFRDGLWTFIEDLRQATVGEEAIYGPQGQNGAAGAKEDGKTTKDAAHGDGKNASVESFASVGKRLDAEQSAALLDIGGTFWKEHGLDEPAAAPQKVKKHAPSSSKSLKAPKSASSSKPSKPSSNSAATNTSDVPQRKSSQRVRSPPKPIPDFEDGWDSWGDSPAPVERRRAAAELLERERRERPVSMASSAFDSAEDVGGSPDGSSPRTSMSSTGVPAPNHSATNASTNGVNAPAASSSSGHHKRDSIPWPALVKLAPSKLTRTASNLMNEWEKSISPPVEQKKRADGKDDDSDDFFAGSATRTRADEREVAFKED
ncbi:hypothetical protein BDY21DRAFT_380570 [Lineolata rhizophorae]|uniref:DUF4048 domain-containing protein n=1 Tax=Lineolata rhizophorae TaxID=578093 RepID=A0A6A6NVK5_9PEZI|nr:hypothetical protein BDY21DRAFT_380570 [Lineolata rhizophorae]